jgi:hypothetical protein
VGRGEASGATGIMRAVSENTNKPHASDNINHLQETSLAQTAPKTTINDKILPRKKKTLAKKRQTK